MSQFPTEMPNRSPYDDDSLSLDAKADLSVLVHFLLLFGEALGLCPHELLHSQAENSLLSQTERPFEALVSFLASASNTSLKKFLGHLSASPTSAEKLAYLRDLTESYAHHADLRRFIISEDGRVLPSARLRIGARDSEGLSYTWLRGPDGCCSDRIVAASDANGCRILRTEQVLEAVKQLESGSRRRHDLLAAGWLRERVDRCAARSSRVQLAEDERRRKQESARHKSGLIGGLQVDIVGCGRGRRERKPVCYEEDNADDDLSVSEEEDGDPEEFVADSGSEQDSDGTYDEGERSDCGEGWDTHPAAAGRHRIVSGFSRTRSRAAVEEDGRTTRKSLRLLRRSHL